MNYWLTTDWHKNHENIKVYEGRPDNFDALIVAHHNAVMQPEDVLINFGDTIFARRHELKEYLALFNCRKKILIRGNHDDHFTDSWLMNQGFDFVCDAITIDGVLMSHAPMQITEDILLNVHGHMHSGIHRQDEVWYPYYSDRHVLLGLENTNYYPINLKDVKNGRWTVNGVIRRA